MREVVFDTETTGLSFDQGHKIIEIGMIALKNRVQTGEQLHLYINPGREIEQSAIRVHGITNDAVADCPPFADVAAQILDFIADSPLVAHNITFDMSFLNGELMAAGFEPLTNELVDTLAMARKMFPGARHSLDALCQRYNVDLSARKLHGALLDTQLLADVYLEMTGGLQPDMMGALTSAADAAKKAAATVQRAQRTPRPHAPSADELGAHRAFLEKHVPQHLWGAFIKD